MKMNTDKIMGIGFVIFALGLGYGLYILGVIGMQMWMVNIFLGTSITGGSIIIYGEIKSYKELNNILKKKE